jgi:hypothetical protein
MHLPDTVQDQRREHATDARGVPSSFARALKALAERCAHCEARAVVADGSGVGLCATHRRERIAAHDVGMRRLERARRAIDMAKREA